MGQRIAIAELALKASGGSLDCIGQDIIFKEAYTCIVSAITGGKPAKDEDG